MIRELFIEKGRSRGDIKNVDPDLSALILPHNLYECDNMDTIMMHERRGAEERQVAAWILELMEYQNVRVRVILLMHHETETYLLACLTGNKEVLAWSEEQFNPDLRNNWAPEIVASGSSVFVFPYS